MVAQARCLEGAIITGGEPFAPLSAHGLPSAVGG